MLRFFVPSCAKYADAWEPFGKFLRQAWPDRDPDRVQFTLVTDSIPKHANIDGCFDGVCEVGEDRGWAKNMLYALEEFDDREPVCGVVMEDFWIEQVDPCFIEFATEQTERRGVGQFKLYAAPAATESIEPYTDRLGRLHDEAYGFVARGTPYRVSLCQSLWQRHFLKWLLEQVGTPWEFEIRGTELAEKHPIPIMATTNQYRPMVCLYTAITRGKWEPGAIRRANELGIHVDTSRLPIMER